MTEQTAIQTTTDPRKSLHTFLAGDAMKKQFAVALPKILPVDRFIRCLVTTINRTPDLLKCDRSSILAGAMTAAQLGLEIDPALGRAYLLPYNDRQKGKVAQLIIGYKGYVDLAYRSGLLSGLQAEPVYSKDHFKYRYGLSPIIEHVPSEDEDRGGLTHCYAIASLVNGGQVWRVLSRTEVMRHKASSPAAKSSYSPWTTHEPEMWRKTAIRALASIMPLSPELRDAIAADTESEVHGKPVDISEMIVDTGSPEDVLASVATTDEPDAK